MFVGNGVCEGGRTYFLLPTPPSTAPFILAHDQDFAVPKRATSWVETLYIKPGQYNFSEMMWIILAVLRSRDSEILLLPRERLQNGDDVMSLSM